MKAMYVELPDGTVAELRTIAEREFRSPRDQVAALVVEGLDRRRRARQPLAPVTTARQAVRAVVR